MRSFIFLIILVGSLTASRPKRQLNVKCKDNPCLNGGKCVQVAKFLAYCACYPGFYGKDCSITSTLSTTTTYSNPNQFYFPCPNNVPNPCLNGGKCFYSQLMKTIQCECRPGYNDTFCIQLNNG